MSRHRTFVTYLTACLFAIGTAVRYVVKYTGDPLFWPVTGLLAVFLALLAIEPWLSRRSRLHTHLYLAVQTGIAVVLSLIPQKWIISPFYSYLLPCKLYTFSSLELAFVG